MKTTVEGGEIMAMKVVIISPGIVAV